MRDSGIRVLDVVSWLFFTILIFLSALLYIPLKLMSYVLRLFRRAVR